MPLDFVPMCLLINVALVDSKKKKNVALVESIYELGNTMYWGFDMDYFWENGKCLALMDCLIWWQGQTRMHVCMCACCVHMYGSLLEYADLEALWDPIEYFRGYSYYLLVSVWGSLLLCIWVAYLWLMGSGVDKDITIWWDTFNLKQSLQELLRFWFLLMLYNCPNLMYILMHFRISNQCCDVLNYGQKDEEYTVM